VFIGNINQSVEMLVKTSHLLAPFPAAMIDTAFFDRFHAYIPGWEVPKMRPEFFTNRYGLIADYLAEFMREMRKRNFADVIDKYFKLGNNLNQRDVIAVRRTTSGLLKLMYPHEGYEKDDVRQCLIYALEGRRRIKEQLKKLGGMEFFDVHFSYIDNDTLEEFFVNVPEQGGSKLIAEGSTLPGVVHLVSPGNSGHLGLYRYETQMTSGNGKHNTSGLGSNTAAKEAVRIGFDYFKGNLQRISASARFADHEYHLHIVEHHGNGPSIRSSLAALVALCSILLKRPVQDQMVVLGDMSLGGVVNPVDDLAGSLQMAMDCGATRVLIPMASMGDITSVPGELFAKFQSSFYTDPIDAVFKALGVQ
jgi:ATP-dependent Lon protease